MAKKKNNTKRRKGMKRWRQLSFFGKVWRFCWVTVVALFGFSLFQVLFCSVFNPPLTPLMVERFFDQMGEKDRKVVFERDYVSIDNISPHLINAVAISEDGGLFMYHHGFFIHRMKEVYLKNQRGGKQAGASTISQQTAKNCFLPHTRSMWRKALEAYYTVLIEKVWGKRRIMECYLNIIEFADGIYGCEAAAQHYFNHSAKELTRREAALLAACLPHPLRSNPGRPSGYLSRRASTIQGRMGTYGSVAKREDDKIVMVEGKNKKYIKMVEEENLFDFAIWMLEHRSK